MSIIILSTIVKGIITKMNKKSTRKRKGSIIRKSMLMVIPIFVLAIISNVFSYMNIQQIYNTGGKVSSDYFFLIRGWDDVTTNFNTIEQTVYYYGSKNAEERKATDEEFAATKQQVADIF